MISEDQLVKVFFEGMREGIRMYAHGFEYGQQYVGTTGDTLDSALSKVNEFEKIWIQDYDKFLTNIVPGIIK